MWIDQRVAISACHPSWLWDMAGPWAAEVQFGSVASIHGSIGSPSFCGAYTDELKSTQHVGLRR